MTEPTPVEVPADTALAAQVAEATQPEDTRPKVEFRGKTFTLRKRPSVAYLWHAPRDPMLAIKLVFPNEKDFDTLLDLDLDVEDLNEFSEAMAKAWGLDNAGN